MSPNDAGAMSRQHEHEQQGEGEPTRLLDHRL
jgi:hypothetical protein